MKHFTVSEYRQEVLTLSDLAMDMESNAYKAQEKKIEAMQMAMLMNPGTSYFMEREIIDTLSSLNDCAAPMDAPEVQHSLWLLETCGYENDAQEIREWDWL